MKIPEVAVSCRCVDCGLGRGLVRMTLDSAEFGSYSFEGWEYNMTALNKDLLRRLNILSLPIYKFLTPVAV